LQRLGRVCTPQPPYACPEPYYAMARQHVLAACQFVLGRPLNRHTVDAGSKEGRENKWKGGSGRHARSLKACYVSGRRGAAAVQTGKQGGVL